MMKKFLFIIGLLTLTATISAAQTNTGKTTLHTEQNGKTTLDKNGKTTLDKNGKTTLDKNGKTTLDKNGKTT
ncbi:MAG: hypothetical protein IIU03_09920, partial [Bacteroidales bacterium]|nr:hypothetical protein [Bacteroidales bacterium]